MQMKPRGRLGEQGIVLFYRIKKHERRACYDDSAPIVDNTAEGLSFVATASLTQQRKP